MDTSDSKRHPDGRTHVPGLIWRNGVLWADTACRGKRLSFSTRTTDFQEAERQLRAAQTKAQAEAAGRDADLPPSIRDMLSLPDQDPISRNRKRDPSADGAQATEEKAEPATSSDWEMRVRGLVDSYRSGQPLITAAATYRINWLHAVHWMLKCRIPWFTEMLERK